MDERQFGGCFCFIKLTDGKLNLSLTELKMTLGIYFWLRFSQISVVCFKTVGGFKGS